MQVRVINGSSLEPGAAADYVRVHLSADPADDTVTLATIERVTAWGSEETAIRKNSACQVRPLVVNQPMSQEEALVLAKRYANYKNIEVVCAERG